MTNFQKYSKSQLIDKILSQEEELISLKKKYRALQKDKIYLKEIMTYMPGNIFCKDKHGRYIGCNQNVARLLGANSIDDVIGKFDRDFLAADIASHLEKADQEVIKSGVSCVLEEKGLNEYHEPAIFLSQKIPFRNQSGDIIGILGISFNISDRKKMEENLQLAKTQAEEASQAKTQFLAIINHELRTPVTALIGLIAILNKNTLSNSEQKDMLNTMENCAKYLLNLVNDMLDISKLEMNKVNLHLQQVNLRSLINEIYNILHPLAANKGIQFEVHIDNTIPRTLFSDAHILRQILLNLINNAIKFTTKGQVIITVTKIKQTKHKTQLKIAVADTGKGIPDDKLDVIFEPFQQLEDAYIRQSSRNGTGLGLTIVKKLAALIGLEIHVSSKFRKGSVFSLIGDFETSKKDSSLEEQEEETPTAESIYPDILLRKPNVLLVEDDPVIQFLHKRMLNDLGCDVEISSQGRDALEKFNRHDIIFVDISLPDISGFEVIKLIRNFNSSQDTPIVALTSHATHEERSASLNAGANVFVTKPITSSKLKELILQYIRQ